MIIRYWLEILCNQSQIGELVTSWYEQLTITYIFSKITTIWFQHHPPIYSNISTFFYKRIRDSHAAWEMKLNANVQIHWKNIHKNLLFYTAHPFQSSSVSVWTLKSNHKRIVIKKTDFFYRTSLKNCNLQ